jgi:hypothetical protein
MRKVQMNKMGFLDSLEGESGHMTTFALSQRRRLLIISFYEPTVSSAATGKCAVIMCAARFVESDVTYLHRDPFVELRDSS